MTDESTIPSVYEFDDDPDSIEAPEVLPKAWYPGTIVEVQMAERKSGLPGPNVKVHIDPDSFPPDFDAESYPEGVDIYYRMLSFGPSRAHKWRVKKFCNSIGAEFHSGLDPVEEWIDKSAYWDVRAEPSLNDPDEKVNSIMGVSDEPKE